METVAGVFDSRAEADRAIQGLRSAGFAEDRIAFLTPGAATMRLKRPFPHTETEQPGMGSGNGWNSRRGHGDRRRRLAGGGRR